MLEQPLGRTIDEIDDTLSAWLGRFREEDGTTFRNHRGLRVDIWDFLDFLRRRPGGSARSSWTPQVSRDFIDYLRHEMRRDGRRCWSDRVANRITLHLKLFAQWIHLQRPFPEGDPMAGIDVIGR